MATSFKSQQPNDGAETVEDKECPEGSSQDLPREEQNDCTQPYSAERHKFTERASRDRVPSAGWRAVYASMEVSVR